MLTTKDLEKFHKAGERILDALDKSSVPISWHEMDRLALQSVIAKELILMEKDIPDCEHCKVYTSDTCKRYPLPLSVTEAISGKRGDAK